VAPNIQGEIPEAHAKRVVFEMVDFLAQASLASRHDFIAAMNAPIGGNPKSQQRWANRVNRSTVPIVADFATSWGKRAKFTMILSLWTPDEHGGATVWNFMVKSDGPGTEQKSKGPFWRFSNHALVRLVQRSGATDAIKLMQVMREVAKSVGDGMASAMLMKGDGQLLHVKFKGGYAVIDWPDNSDVAVLKTILGPDMAVPLPGLH
jgi:hypothetical protein